MLNLVLATGCVRTKDLSGSTVGPRDTARSLRRVRPRGSRLDDALRIADDVLEVEDGSGANLSCRSHTMTATCS
jgi:hypothetical protein